MRTLKRIVRGVRSWRARVALTGVLVMAIVGVGDVANADEIMMVVNGPEAASRQMELRGALPAGHVAVEGDAQVRKVSALLAPAQAAAKRQRAVSRAQAVAKKARAGVAAVVWAKSAGKAQRSVLVVVAAPSGTVLFAEDVEGAAVSEKLRAVLPAPSAVAAEAVVAGPAVVAAAPAAESTTEVRSVATRPAREGPWIEVGAGLAVGGRRFAYNDQVTGTLRPYQVFGAPLAQIGLTVFPLVLPGVLAGMAVFGELSQSFAFDSQGDAGATLDTTWRNYAAGLSWRMPVGAMGSRAQVSLAYGRDRFELKAPEDGTVYPSASYGHVRLNGELGARIATRVGVEVSAGYRLLTDVGALADAFPRAAGGGVDLAIAGSYALTGKWSLRAELGYTRYFFSLSPAPGDAHVAGGALDEYLAAGLGVTYAL